MPEPKARNERMNRRATKSESDCRFYKDRLHAHVELELDEATSAFVTAHLRTCDRCREEVEAHEIDRLELLGKIVDAPELPSNFASKVTAAIRDRDARQLEERRLVSWRFVTGLAAGVVLGALIVAVALSLRQPTTNEIVAQAGDPAPVLPPVSGDAEPIKDSEVEQMVLVNEKSLLGESAETGELIADIAASIFDDEEDPCDDIDHNGTVDGSDLYYQVYQIFDQRQSAELVVALHAVEHDCLNLCSWRS